MRAERAHRSAFKPASPSAKGTETSKSSIATLGRRRGTEAMLTLRARPYKF